MFCRLNTLFDTMLTAVYAIELNHLSPPPYALPSNPLFTSICSALADASEKPPPLNRALLQSFISFHPRSHRCCSKRLRHSPDSACCPLPCSSNRGYVRSSVRTYCSRREDGVEHSAMRTGRSSRCVSSMLRNLHCTKHVYKTRHESTCCLVHALSPATLSPKKVLT